MTGVVIGVEMSARTAGKEGTSCKIQSARAGELAQARRALAALAEDLNLVPGTHVCIKICSNTSSRQPNAFPGLCVLLYMVHKYTFRYTYIYIKLIFSK